MKRIIQVWAVALAACEGSITEPLHEVEDCRNSLHDGDCERACSDDDERERSEDQSCGPLDLCTGFSVDEYEGTRGCCVPDGNDVLRFRECE